MGDADRIPVGVGFLGKRLYGCVMKDGQGTVAAVCERLCEVFNREVPLGAKLPQGRKKSAKELAATVDAGLARFYDAARRERTSYGVGVIGRARVAFGVQERLLAAGHPPALVKQVLFAMLVSAFAGFC